MALEAMSAFRVSNSIATDSDLENHRRFKHVVISINIRTLHPIGHHWHFVCKHNLDLFFIAYVVVLT